MYKFQNTSSARLPHAARPRALALEGRPRFLRAVPSLLVLTTAMAWGAVSQAGVLGLDGVLRSSSGLVVAAGPGVGVGGHGGAGVDRHTGVNPEGGVPPGANGNFNANLTMQERVNAGDGSTAAQVRGAAGTTGNVGSVSPGSGRVVGGVRNGVQGAGPMVRP